jgi:serine/threonine-protein kinase
MAADSVPASVAQNSATPTFGPAPKPAEFKPHRFGRYDLLAQLGEGGMGVVYQAYDPQLRRTVAIKQIHPRILTTPADVERFRYEAQAAAQFDHRHIVTVFDVGEHGNKFYFTMTYVPGGMLAQRVPEFRGRPYRAVELVIKVARAVHYAHGKGVVHRDLKPHNILLDEHDEPRVTDFGLARFVADDVAWSERGQRLGTPGYMSPEQACGAADQVGVRSDIWALGVILYELLTGRRPFSAADRKGLTLRICQAEPAPLAQLQPGLPPELDAIVRRCLARRRSPPSATPPRRNWPMPWTAGCAASHGCRASAVACAGGQVWL